MNKQIFPICLLLFLLAVAGCRHGAGSSDEPLYDSVDMALARSHEYDRVKERRIDALRHELGKRPKPTLETELVEELVDEYESYNSDSALHYVNRYLRLPRVAADSSRWLRMTIRKADIASHAGLYKEAMEILENCRPADSDTSLLIEYYNTYCGLYQYQSEYTTDSEFLEENESMRALYNDSLMAICPPESFLYLVVRAPELVREGRAAEAENLLFESLGNYRQGTREYAILSSILAYVYNDIGDHDNYRRYLALSAISDMQGAVKENMAMRALATALFEDGDIERANRYLKQSFADANFFAARMRNAQSSRMLPIIDEAYNTKQADLQRLQRYQLVTISILAVILMLAIAFILRQFKIVKRAQQHTAAANAELSELSQRLREANAGLAEMNSALKIAGATREEYAATFMEFCSSTISSLKNYHRSLRVLAAQGNPAALVKKLESAEIIDKTVNEFYQRFDNAVLDIYPGFVEKFNALLRPECRVQLRPGELLNTELRVFALIRIGIDDSSKIAGFLRCSITTVYTYRSKMRRRALHPDIFEDEVADIS